MRVSVIIPAFNAAVTLPSCLDSFMDGTVEVIVVDDGSTDGTAEIVRKSYPSVRLLQQPNRGVSAARNAGLDVATGDYVTFVDADDQLSPGALKKACTIVNEDGPDILVFRGFAGEVEQYPWVSCFIAGKDYDKNGMQGYMRGSVCGCLFKRFYLRQHRLRFPEGISMAEDQLFLNASIAFGGRIQFRDIRLYEVHEHPGSASRRYDDSYFQRLSAALFRSPDVIPDIRICTRVQLSMIQGITRVAVLTGRTPTEILRLTHLDQALPLSVSQMKKGSLTARTVLLNASYPLFYWATRFKMRFE